jgi:hypothetical protein
VIVAYLTIAMLAGFYLLGMPYSPRGAVDMRSMEVLLLWTLSWLVVGNYAGIRRQWFQHRLGAVMITFMPLLVALPWAVVEAMDSLPRLVDDPRFPHPVWVKVVRITGVTLPLIMGAICASCLWLLMKHWRHALRKGVCRKCSYNLTGNVSGICPECGTPVGETGERRWTIGRREKLVIGCFYVTGLFLFAGGAFFFQVLDRRPTAYVFFGASGLSIAALIILFRRLARHGNLGDKGARSPGQAPRDGHDR